MKFKIINDKVFSVTGPFTSIGKEETEFLKKKALLNERKSARLCTHRENSDSVHEMLIVHSKDNYIRPHKHLYKSESLHVIEGKADMVLFDENGSITDVIAMGVYPAMFYYRLASSYYHTLIIHSDFFVFHETTKGPFHKPDTIYAPWSVDDIDPETVRRYLKILKSKVERWVK